MPGKTPQKKIKVKKDLKTFSQKIGPKLNPKARNLCLKCRGTKKLCGKSTCPVLAKYYSQLSEEKRKKFDTNSIQGDSPPSVFIGRYGYPKVSVGPMVPPEKGNTSIYSSPEEWFGNKDMNDIIEMRGSLVRGKKKLKTNVKITETLDREIEETRYLVLAKRPAETEVEFKKKLTESIKFDGESQPYGPSAVMKSFRRGTTSTHKQLEKIFYDDDLKSRKGVVKLYKKGVNVSRIQDLFMIGGTGLKENRKFVPTRWCITGVDSIISKNLRRDVKTYPLINEWEVYFTNYLDNRWIIIFTPESWRYESIEAFYPETTWNPSSDSIAIFGDYEEYDGRKDYASLGGCYYAARLAVLEKLHQKRRQAGVIVLREVHPGYILPLGVWVTRECVRNALKTKPMKFNSKKKVLQFVKKNLELGLDKWKSVSKLLTTKSTQKRLDNFI